MTVKYTCDITGDEFQRKEINDKVLSCDIVVNSLSQRIGVLHVRKDKTPDIFKENIKNRKLEMKTSDDINEEIYVYVSGRVEPFEKNNNVAYTYIPENPKINSIMQRLVYDVGNDKQITQTYKYDSEDENIQEFKESIEDSVIDFCKKYENRKKKVKNSSKSGVAFH